MQETYTKEEAKSLLHNILCPSFNILPSKTLELDYKREKFNSLISEQCNLLNYLEVHKMPLAEYALKNDVSISEFKSGYIKMTASDKVHPDFILNLHKILTQATGLTWKIEMARGALGVTVADMEKAAEEEEKRNIMEYPLVKAIMAEFKGAKIETATRKMAEEDEDESSNFFGGETSEIIYDEDNEQ